MPQLGYPVGAGASVLTDQNGVDGDHMQVWKIAQSALGSESLIGGDVASQSGGLQVRIGQVLGPMAVQPASSTPMRMRTVNQVVDTSFRIDYVEFWSRSYFFIGGGVDVPIFTPIQNTRAYFQGMSFSIRTSGFIEIFDTVSTPTTRFYRGTPSVGQMTLEYAVPHPQDHPNVNGPGPGSCHIGLTCDTAIVGDVVMWGFLR